MDNKENKSNVIHLSKEDYPELNFEELDNMEDDEAVLEIDKFIEQNDKVVERDYLSSLIEQEDNNLVYYEVENIYKNENNRAYKNRLILKKNPPILVIKDIEDNEANFILTENLTDELIETLKEVKRAYSGFSGPSKLDRPKKFLDKFGYYAKENPIKVIVPFIIIVLLLTLFN